MESSSVEPNPGFREASQHLMQAVAQLAQGLVRY